MQRGLAGFLGLGIVLAGTIALELASRVGDDGGMIASAPSPRRATANPVAAPPSLGDNRQALVEAILARPMFATTRRPSATAPAGPAPVAASLPRLTGILLDGRSRSAIFAAMGGGRPLVVQEGGQIGGYTVQAISAGQVTLASPDGKQVLRPTFDARPQSAASSPATAGPAARGASPFAAATDVMQVLRGLPGLPGAAR